MNPPKSSTPNNSVSIGDVVDLRIDSLSHGGKGVGRHGDLVIFVSFVAPLDRVRVEISQLKKNYADANLIEVLDPSPFRVKPPCPAFGECGGCQWQHVNYEEQLKQKQNIVEHALARIAREENVKIFPIISSPDVFNYRNRAQFRQQGNKIGFFRKQSHEIVEFDECRILEPSLNEELKRLKQEVKRENDYRTRKIELFLKEDMSLQRSLNKAHAEDLGFSQVNTKQNKRLQSLVCELAAIPQKESNDALDLYCGNGNLSFPLNERGWRIYGIDNNRHAIRLARQRANNQTFFSANDVYIETKKLISKGRSFPLIVLDPPRIGAAENLMTAIPKLQPNTIIYVSCNPATFARDWARLKAASSSQLQLKSVTPIDMFPQTFHVELVAQITR